MDAAINARYDNDIVFSGGVARNTGMVIAMEEVLGQKVIVPQEPQLTAALGAALIGLKESRKRKRCA